MSDDLNNLEKLDAKLNKPKAKDFGMDFHHLKKDYVNKDVPYTWNEQNTIVSAIASEKKKFSFGIKLFLSSLILLILALSYTGYRIFSERNSVSSANIDVLLNFKPYIEGGEVAPLVIDIQNHNAISLQNATLTLTYKKGVSSQDETQEVSEKKDIGVLDKDSFVRENFNVQMFGREAEARDINIKLEYKIPGSNAVFNKIVTVSTIIKTPSVSVHIDGPDNIVAGKIASYVINVENKTSSTTLPFLISVSLPLGFNVDSITPKQNGTDLVWKIDKLYVGASTKITINGSFIGNPGENTTIHATVGASSGSSNNIETVFSSDIKDILIQTSPIKLTLVGNINGKETDTFRLGDKVYMVLNYENTSDSEIRGVEFNAHILGSAPDISGVSDDNGSGYYDSTKQLITWNKITLPSLAVISPHSEGSIRFYVPLVTKGSNSTNLRIEISGVGDMVSPKDIVSNLVKNWIVQGGVSLNAWTIYKNSPFQNSGPIPPKVNTETTYTLHLVVSAQNSLESARISFILPLYVKWKDLSSDKSNISYNSSDRSVIWNIGKIGAGSSINTDIQIGVSPSQSHVGIVPSITSGIIFEGTETESRSIIKSTLAPQTTAISGESWSIDTGTVVGN